MPKLCVIHLILDCFLIENATCILCVNLGILYKENVNEVWKQVFKINFVLIVTISKHLKGTGS